jgi:hypothetical protein
MPTPPEVVRTIVTYQDRTAAVRSRVETYARTLWGSLGSWRDADITRMVGQIVPVVGGAQMQMVALTDAYLNAIAVAAGLPMPTGATPARAVTGTATRGVDPREVYRRAGVTVWTALSEGKPLSAAVDEGLHRLLNIAGTDLQLAKTRTSLHRLRGDQTAAGYRRVLTGSEDCAMCVLASTQRYHREDLLPIHPGCDCDVAPIRGGVDPGQVIDPGRLDAIHASVKEQFGKSDLGGREVDYRLIEVRDHGEIGPTLTWRGQHFDGPSNVPAPKAPPAPDRRLDAGDLTAEQGREIAALAQAQARGELTAAEYRRRVRAITGTDTRGRRV